MADHSQAVPRHRLVIDRDDAGRWFWTWNGQRCGRGPYSRIESCVGDVERVLCLKTAWAYSNQRVRELIIVGRPVEVEVRR